MTKQQTTTTSDLDGYNVLVAVCGGIAAYKVCYVVSELVQHGATVHVAMTRAARKFIGPLTFQSLTGRAVLTSLWKSDRPQNAQHIDATEQADLVLIAPATANMIGKIACGIADDLVSTLVISAASPVVLAVAMNTRMWANEAVRDNVATLRRRGLTCIDPGEGRLACGTVGIGRMVEPRDIMETIVPILTAQPPKAGHKGTGDTDA